MIFLLLRADKKVGGEPQNRGGNYLKRIIYLVWPNYVINYSSDLVRIDTAVPYFTWPGSGRPGGGQAGAQSRYAVGYAQQIRVL